MRHGCYDQLIESIFLTNKKITYGGISMGELTILNASDKVKQDILSLHPEVIIVEDTGNFGCCRLSDWKPKKDDQ